MTNISFKENIIGSRNYKTISVMLLLFMGGGSFFFVGIESYFKVFDFSSIQYIPQGILMLFYGTLALIFASYLLLTLIWDVGSGYNQIFKEEQIIYMVRKNFPGKNNFYFFSYPFKIIKQIKLLKKDGLNPRINILLVLKDKREIPLYPPQYSLKLTEMEKKAINLSSILKVPVETKIVS